MTDAKDWLTRLHSTAARMGVRDPAKYTSGLTVADAQAIADLIASQAAEIEWLRGRVVRTEAEMAFLEDRAEAAEAKRDKALLAVERLTKAIDQLYQSSWRK